MPCISPTIWTSHAQEAAAVSTCFLCTCILTRCEIHCKMHHAMPLTYHMNFACSRGSCNVDLWLLFLLIAHMQVCLSVVFFVKCRGVCSAFRSLQSYGLSVFCTRMKPCCRCIQGLNFEVTMNVPMNVPMDVPMDVPMNVPVDKRSLPSGLRQFNSHQSSFLKADPFNRRRTSWSCKGCT